MARAAAICGPAARRGSPCREWCKKLCACVRPRPREGESLSVKRARSCHHRTSHKGRGKATHRRGEAPSRLCSELSLLDGNNRRTSTCRARCSPHRDGRSLRKTATGTAARDDAAMTFSVRGARVALFGRPHGSSLTRFPLAGLASPAFACSTCASLFESKTNRPATRFCFILVDGTR